MKPVLPNKKRISHNIQWVEKTTSVILNYDSLNSDQNKNIECKQVIILIDEIAKSIVLPSNFEDTTLT